MEIPKDVRPCKRCKAPIFFATTEKQGRPVPLDEVPEKRYTLQFRPDVGDGLHGGTVVATLQETYVTHFVTCPNAADFRKKRAK